MFPRGTTKPGGRLTRDRRRKPSAAEIATALDGRYRPEHVCEPRCRLTVWENFKKTGGKVQSSRTRRGKGRAAHALRLAAWSLMRSKGALGALGAYLRRQRSRLGAPKAITAAAHKLARIVYHLMRYGEAYVKQSEPEYAEQVRERLERQLARRAKEMGYELKKVEAPPPEPASGG